MAVSETSPPPLRSVPTSLGLGERMRSARKARALTVAQVAEALRLEESSVIALEEGRFEALGAPVFVRGHLKRYALLLELDPEMVLEAYRAAAPGSDAPPALGRAQTEPEARAPAAWIWWLLAAVLLIGGFLMFRGDADAPSGVAVPAPAPTTVPMPIPVPPQPTPPDTHAGTDNSLPSLPLPAAVGVTP